MITLLLKGINIVLFTIAGCFIFIELKAKLNRTFLYWAISIIILTLFSAIDLWIQPKNSDTLWINIQHILICFYPPFVILYLAGFLNQNFNTHIKYLFSTAFLLSILFAGTFMLKEFSDGVRPTFLYFFFFVPYLITSFYLVNRLIVKYYDEVDESKQKIIRSHIFSISFLLFCGLTDLYRLAFNHDFFIEIMSFTLFGTLSMGLVLGANFAEFMVEIIKAEQKHEKLELAYKELEEARALSELGKSSAIINHEIKNYATAISGYAELILMKGGLDNRFQEMAQKIINSVRSLQSFSNDILDFSKSKILENMQPVNLTERIIKTIKNSFPDQERCFNISDLPADVIIHGDWFKLEHVFMNLFKNAFQACAQNITLRVKINESTILLTISDDGNGITKGDPQSIFKAFYTTKGKNGTGLGLPITRSIIEGHGGHINVTSKNLTTENEHGLIFTLVFPRYLETMNDTEIIDFSILLIKNGTPNFEEVIRIFRNVFINPEIIGDFNELKKSAAPSDKLTILGGAETIGELNILYKGQKGYTIVDNPTKGLSVLGNQDDMYSGPFDEEFIINYLVSKKD